ncbi:MAG TPA: YfiR family protein [Hanamia sp.]|nr:YfiR family protein [Hanamia sp.]
MILKKLLFIVLLSCTGIHVSAQDATQEANLKAAFIYNIAKYIDWGGYNNRNEFIIGVVGNSSKVIIPLQEIAKNRTIANKRIVIVTIDNLAQIKDCDIVFISKESPFSLSSILSRLAPGELTISESKGYASRGTDFNFVIVDQRLKFEANLKAISSSGLKAGSQLLKLAIITD